MARELIVSPRGEAAWAKILGEPVAYEDNPRAWSITLLLDPSDPETIAFVERLEGVFQGFHGTGAKVAANGWPFADETAPDEKGRKVRTGRLQFNFKRKQETARGFLKPAPLVVDAKKNLWPEGELIGNGSKVKVAFTPWSWSTQTGKGMSLELESVQVLDLVPYAKPDPVAAFEEEDGYVAETPAAQTPFQQEAAPSSFADQLKARAAAVAAEAAGLEEDLPF